MKPINWNRTILWCGVIWSFTGAINDLSKLNIGGFIKDITILIFFIGAIRVARHND